MPDHLLQRLKIFFLLSCGLSIAAITGWGGFVYKTVSAHQLSDQVISLMAERKSLTVQRDAAVHEIEKLKPAQLEAKLSAGAECDSRLQPNKTSSEASSTSDQMAALVRRIQQRSNLDFSQTGSIRKTDRRSRQ
jgi:hypothetical protein